MMGPEAAVVSERIAEIRALGHCARVSMPKAGPMYAEVAALGQLEPFFAFERPARWRGVWARLRGAFGRPEARDGESGPGWTVAAAPIVTKSVLAGTDGDGGAAGLLAGLPLQTLTPRS